MSTLAEMDQVYSLLDDSLPVIHTALIQYYGFSEPEAEAFKDTLAVWFHRVVRRSGFRSDNASEYREQLLFVACKYASAFQLARLRDGRPFQPELQTAFSRPPEEVAMALLKRIGSGVSV